MWQFSSSSTGFGMTALTTGRTTSYDFCQRISLADNEVPTGTRTATCHMSRGIKFGTVYSSAVHDLSLLAVTRVAG